MNIDEKLLEILTKLTLGRVGPMKTIDTIKELFNQEWVSVEDRLPEKQGWYLVFSPAYYGIDIMLFRDNKWYADETSQTSGNTHWQPLPQPPNNKGKGNE